jgi:hypothetical protein
MWLTHTEKTEHSIIFAKIRQSKMLIVKEMWWVGMLRVQMTWDRMKKQDGVNKVMEYP